MESDVLETGFTGSVSFPLIGGLWVGGQVGV